MITVIDNFIPESYQNALIQEFEGELSWFYSNSAAGVCENFDTTDSNIIDSTQFVHGIVEDNKGISPTYPLIFPLIWFLEKEKHIKVKNVLRVKANLMTRDGREIKYQPPHVDVYGPGFLTMIYYINDSDGDTIIFDKLHDQGHCNLNITKRITPKKGRILLLPSNVFHSSSCPIRTKRRTVLNFILEI